MRWRQLSLQNPWLLALWVFSMAEGSFDELSSLLTLNTASADNCQLQLLRPPRGSGHGTVRAPGLCAWLMPFLLRMTYCFYFFPKTLNMNQKAYEMSHWKFSSKCKNTKRNVLDWYAELYVMPDRHLAAALPPGTRPWAAPRGADPALQTEPTVSGHSTWGATDV